MSFDKGITRRTNFPEVENFTVFAHQFIDFIETVFSDSRMILGYNLIIGHPFEYLGFLIEPFFAESRMNTFLEYESDIILGVGFHVPEEVEVVDSAHEIIFELIEFFVDFLFKFFEGNIEVDVVQTIRVVDLVTVDELCELGLFFLHG